MSAPDELTWAPLRDADFDGLVALAAACVRADGGLPFASEPSFVRRRWAMDGTASRAVHDAAGRLVAAAAVRPGPDGRGATVVSLVHPDHRDRGYDASLLDWGLAEAGRRDGVVTVETESLTPIQEALFASRRLRQVFAEDVMRADLTAPVPPPVWPVGTTVREWNTHTEPRFFALYEASFRERPGFPGWRAAQWIAEVADDEEFRPAWSVIATVPGRGDIGFVTAAVGWIVQVGVAPAARGEGLGAALIREALTRMQDDGATEVWLDVNVNNPAAKLYERLGFRHEGRRARYQP
jgi:mycothiol synthase